MTMTSYFNPRTREGCDRGTLFSIRIVLAISIHAPVKGATEYDTAAFTALFISIHAPVKGATRPYTGKLTCNYYFNPRTREGCDYHDF